MEEETKLEAEGQPLEPANTQPTTTPGGKLCQYTLLVVLKPEGEELVPVIKWQYPDAEPENPDPMLHNVATFCFPDATALAQKGKDIIRKKDSFSFVLTRQDGQKWVLEPSTGLPECLCVLTFIPCTELFTKILNELVERGRIQEACIAFIKAIEEHPIPAPGTTVPVMVRSNKGKEEEVLLYRPNAINALFDEKSIITLLQLLEPSHIISLFLSLLLERRIVFLAERLRTLTHCIQAFVSLLHPFSWQHIFVPILPPSLMSFLCAPMPFFIGILSSSFPELKKVASSMEQEVIIYELDEGKFLSKRTTEDLGLVPPTTASFLTEKVERLAKWTKGHSGFRRRFRSGASRLQAQSLLKEKLSVFLHFFVELMRKYHDFDAVEEDKPFFDVDAFVRSRPADIRPFLEQFVQSQMFQMFLQQEASHRHEFEDKLKSRELEQGSSWRVDSSDGVSGASAGLPPADEAFRRRTSDASEEANRASDGEGAAEEDRFKFGIPFKRSGKWMTRAKTTLGTPTTTTEDDEMFLTSSSDAKPKKKKHETQGKRNSLLKELKDLNLANEADAVTSPSHSPQQEKPGGQHARRPSRTGMLIRHVTDLPSRTRRHSRSPSGTITLQEDQPDDPEDRTLQPVTSTSLPGSPISPRHHESPQSGSRSSGGSPMVPPHNPGGHNRPGHLRSGSMIVFGSGSVPYNKSNNLSAPANKKQERRVSGGSIHDLEEQRYYEFLASAVSTSVISGLEEADDVIEVRSGSSERPEKGKEEKVSKHDSEKEKRDKTRASGDKRKEKGDKKTKADKQQQQQQQNQQDGLLPASSKGSSPSKSERRRSFNIISSNRDLV